MAMRRLLCARSRRVGTTKEPDAMEEMPSLFNHRVGLSYTVRLNGIGISSLSVTAAKTGDSYVDDQVQESIPLYANYIWPGSILMADYLQQNPDLITHKQVLELGSGTGLPSLVCSKLQASLVVCTDYPEPVVIDNLANLKDRNKCGNMIIQSFEWGDAEQLEQLRSLTNEGKGFDVILLAELLWKDTYKLHDVLVKSVKMVCAAGGTVLVAFAHRPSKAHHPENDLEFIKKLEEELSVQASLQLKCSTYKDAIELEYPEVFLYRLCNM